MTFFNPQTLSVADPVRSSNVLGNIGWRGTVKDERDATRMSRMGLRTIRTLADEQWMRYGRVTETKVLKTLRKNQTV